MKRVPPPAPKPRVLQKLPKVPVSGKEEFGEASQKPELLTDAETTLSKQSTNKETVEASGPLPDSAPSHPQQELSVGQSLSGEATTSIDPKSNTDSSQGGVAQELKVMPLKKPPLPIATTVSRKQKGVPPPVPLSKQNRFDKPKDDIQHKTPLGHNQPAILPVITLSKQEIYQTVPEQSNNDTSQIQKEPSKSILPSEPTQQDLISNLTQSRTHKLTQERTITLFPPQTTSVATPFPLGTTNAAPLPSRAAAVIDELTGNYSDSTSRLQLRLQSMQTALKDLQQVALENEEEDEEDGEKFEEEADEGNRADDSADRQVDEPAVLEDDKLKKEAVQELIKEDANKIASDVVHGSPRGSISLQIDSNTSRHKLVQGEDFVIQQQQPEEYDNDGAILVMKDQQDSQHKEHSPFLEQFEAQPQGQTPLSESKLAKYQGQLQMKCEIELSWPMVSTDRVRSVEQLLTAFEEGKAIYQRNINSLKELATEHTHLQNLKLQKIYSKLALLSQKNQEIMTLCPKEPTKRSKDQMLTDQQVFRII